MLYKVAPTFASVDGILKVQWKFYWTIFLFDIVQYYAIQGGLEFWTVQ